MGSRTIRFPQLKQEKDPMTNLYNAAARTVIGVAGAGLLSLGVLTVTVAPALSSSIPQVATQSA